MLDLYAFHRRCIGILSRDIEWGEEANKKKLPRNERFASSNNEGLSKPLIARLVPPTIVPIPAGPFDHSFPTTPPTNNSPPIRPSKSRKFSFHLLVYNRSLFNCSIIIHPPLENNFAILSNSFPRTRSIFAFVIEIVDDLGNN